MKHCMKKLFMVLILLITVLGYGCTKNEAKYYNVTFICDESNVNVEIEGIVNKTGAYYGDIDIYITVTDNYIYQYAIDLLTNDMYSEQTFTIASIDRDYEFQVFIEEKEKDPIDEYYESINKDYTGNELKLALRKLITDTHTKKTTYDDCKNVKYISETDKDPNNPGCILLFWSNISIPCIWDSGKTWNREHVWPQSKGWFNTSGAGSDLHHIRPADPRVNTVHGNDIYAVIVGSSYVKTSEVNGNVTTGCKSNGDYFEPVDNRKGDVARIIFYLLTRYSESDVYTITNVCLSMNLLLEWNNLDPVDETEINRNDAVYKIQGNRNPFIDNSDYANLIWG